MLIGELSEATGVSTKALRYYEEQGLLHSPDRTSGGYRDYPRQVIRRVAFIKQAQAAGLTLREIRGILAIRDDGAAPCHHLREVVDRRLADIEQRLADLRSTRRQLREVHRRLDGLEPTECDPSVVCSAIT